MAMWRVTMGGGSMPESQESGPEPSVRFGREFGGGMFLVLLAIAGLIGSWPLSFGQLSGIGPGLMPRTTAVLVGAIGIVLILQGFIFRSEPLDRWSLRGIVFVLGAIAVFAASIRTLGLAFAAPASILLASLGDPDTRWKEIVPFAIVLSAFCIGLFKYLLRLPIPLAPTVLGY